MFKLSSFWVGELATLGVWGLLAKQGHAQNLDVDKSVRAPVESSVVSGFRRASTN